MKLPFQKTLDQGFTPLKTPLIVASIYGAISIVYIIASSYVARIWASSPEIQFKIETYKGICFIILTSLLIFVLTFTLLRQIVLIQKRLADQQKQLLIMEKYRMISLISSVVGHDINNALAIASISLGLMKENSQAANQESIQEALAKARDLARSLSSKVQKTYHEHTEFDPNVLIQSTLALIRKHPSALNCKISFASSAPGKIKGNPQILEQAIINLILNAAAATKGSGAIKISLKLDQSSLVISVEDNGPGVPNEKRTQIFEPFYTTKSEGTGLGLLSVQMCAETHRGSVTVKDSYMGGACFEMVLHAPATA